jgi:hypothetical protein
MGLFGFRKNWYALKSIIEGLKAGYTDYTIK